MRNLFSRLATRVTEWSGSVWASLLAVAVVTAWLIGLPIVGLSDTYQLLINTGTTIVTFLMVFFIQNAQNRDNKALQLKLDELIAVQGGARNSLIGLENLSEEQMARLEAEFERIVAEEKASVAQGQSEAL